ncbi:MAG: O-antigen ligase family protein [Patescibacteria group bacterium]
MHQTHLSSPPWRLISQVIFLGFLTVALSLLVDPALALLFLALVIILYLFFKFPAHGLYLLIFFYPLLGFRLLIPRVPESWYQYFPDGLNVAYVDVLALGLLIGFLARLFYLWLKGETWIGLRRFPLWPFFLAFFAVSALSVVNSETPLLSWKYLARPLFFFFACFVFLPWNIIDSRKVFYTAVKVFWATGILAALAALAYFVVSGAGLIRLVPAVVFGVYPWGENWNLLAEIMVAVWPAGIILYYVSKSKYRAIYFIGALLMIFTALGTFARTAWVALLAQAALWFFLEYRARAKKLLPYILIAAVLLLPMLGYMYFLSAGPIVESSTTARLALSSIAWYLFTLHPLLGAGAGTFIDNLGGIKYFTVDFGEPLDAHGWPQKLIAEEGILGLIAFVALLAAILWKILRQYLIPERALEEKIIFFFFLTAAGSIVYQFFNTQYYSSKLWVPLGLALVASRMGRK